ncbi:MAG: ATP-dependent Clp protease proteolytic subunit [Desulfonauticus sp.]|nr:ATP-dependent Clp protease proteolytic subunit [Desulfonauticus sp.]
MNYMDLFWLFFILSALQPVFKQKMLEATRQRLIAKIEKKRNSRVILLIHRQETMSFLGFPVFKYIDIQDSEEVLRAIHLTDPTLPLDIVLHTPGGLVLASLQIARALKQHKGKVTVFVPHYAMSGGTMIALAADEIVMTNSSVLGPIDPQLGQYPAASLLRTVEKKNVDKLEDKTLIMADMAQMAIQQVKDAAYELLSKNYPEEKARELSQILSEGRWTHDYALTFEEAKKLGLKVSNDMPEDILQLLSLYPQPVRKMPSVEYLPIPRKDMHTK